MSTPCYYCELDKNKDCAYCIHEVDIIDLLQQAHRAGWEQCKVQIVAEWEKPYGLTDGTAFINRLRSMEYKGLKNCVEK